MSIENFFILHFLDFEGMYAWRGKHSLNAIN